MLKAKLSNKKKLIVEIISFMIILLFVYASLIKLIDHDKFVIQLGQSPILMAFAGWVAWLVPSAELAIALLLSFYKTRLIGFLFSYIMMVIFSAYIIIILNYAEKIPCSCGGILEKMNWSTHLIFNIAFVILIAMGCYLQKAELGNVKS